MSYFEDNRGYCLSRLIDKKFTAGYVEADKIMVDGKEIPEKEITAAWSLFGEEIQTEHENFMKEARLRESDLEFIRVIEDVVDTLIIKGVIKKDDLPASAVAKYDKRKSLR